MRSRTRGQRRVKVRETPLGRGVFAARGFSPREMVGAIRGRVIDNPRGESRYSIDYGLNRALEPRPPFRFLNHSCVPNCEIVFLDDADGHRRLFVQTRRDIEPGEELTIDYAWPAAFAIPCLCGTAECRGWVVAVDQLPTLKDRVASVDVS